MTKWTLPLGLELHRRFRDDASWETFISGKIVILREADLYVRDLKPVNPERYMRRDTNTLNRTVYYWLPDTNDFDMIGIQDFELVAKKSDD